MDFNGGQNNKLNKCIIRNAINFDGKIDSSQIGTNEYKGKIKIDNDLVLSACYSGVAGLDIPIFDMNDGNPSYLSIRGYSGGIELINANTSGDTSTIDMLGGVIEISPTCTNGEININGMCEVIDNSNSGCTVINDALSRESIADSTWDEPIADHLTIGSTGYALYNVSAGASPQIIADAVWSQHMSGYTTPGTAGYSISYLVDVSSGQTQKLDTVSDDVKRILGLTQENFRIKDHLYDSNNLLQSATISIYNSSVDCDNDINPLAEYSMTALYDAAGRLTSYKVIKN